VLAVLKKRAYKVCTGDYVAMKHPKKQQGCKKFSGQPAVTQKNKRAVTQRRPTLRKQDT
jgi:hypothetical protein